MKVICTISHEIPRGAGKFDVYEAGRVYDLDEYESRYFTPVESARGSTRLKTKDVKHEEEVTDNGTSE